MHEIHLNLLCEPTWDWIGKGSQILVWIDPKNLFCTILTTLIYHVGDYIFWNIPKIFQKTSIGKLEKNIKILLWPKKMLHYIIM
jgi:hypothetical protein